MSIGNRLRKRRKELGFSLQKLASLCELSKSYIHNLESGMVTNPSIRSVEVIAEKMGISPSYLAGWSDNYEVINSLAMKIAALIESEE